MNTLNTNKYGIIKNDNMVWIIVVIVFIVVFGIILAVLNHAKDKPDSPQALVAAAFLSPAGFHNTMSNYLCNPILTNSIMPGNSGWHYLYLCPIHGGTDKIYFNANGDPKCPVCHKDMVLNQ